MTFELSHLLDYLPLSSIKLACMNSGHVSVAWWVWSGIHDGMSVVLRVREQVCVASDHELLELADVDGVTLGFVDFLNHVPQDLNLLFFRLDCIAEVIHLLASVRLLSRFSALQQHLLLQISDGPLLVDENALEGLDFFQLLANNLVQLFILGISSLLSLKLFGFEPIRQLTHLIVLVLQDSVDSFRLEFHPLKLELAAFKYLPAFVLILFNCVPLVTHFTMLGLKFLIHDFDLMALGQYFLVFDLELHLQLDHLVVKAISFAFNVVHDVCLRRFEL